MATRLDKDKSLAFRLASSYVLDVCGTLEAIPIEIVHLCMVFGLCDHFNNLNQDNINVHIEMSTGTSLESCSWFEACVVTGSMEVMKGYTHEWRIKVCGSKHSAKAIGICSIESMNAIRRSIKLKDAYFLTHDGWKVNGDSNEKFGSQWKENDIIRMRLDMDKGNLYFAYGHYDYTLAFGQIDVTKIYRMAFRSWDDGVSIELL